MDPDRFQQRDIKRRLVRLEEAVMRLEAHRRDQKALIGVLEHEVYHLTQDSRESQDGQEESKRPTMHRFDCSYDL